MWRVVELLYVERVVFKLDHRSFVVVDIAVVRSREYRDDDRELLRPVPLVHFVAVELRLVSPQHRQDPVPLQKLVDRLAPEEERTAANLVRNESPRAVALVVLNGVRPQDVAKEARSRRLLKAL